MGYLPEQYYSPLQKTVAYVVSSLNQDDKSDFFNRILFEGEVRQPYHIFNAGFLAHFISESLQNESSVTHQICKNGKDELIFRIYLNYFNAISYVFPWEWKTAVVAAALFGLAEDVFGICKEKKDFSYEVMCSALLLLSVVEENEVAEFTSSGELCRILRGRAFNRDMK